VVWWYRTREDAVSGRSWAAALRAAALLTAWLILVNPSLPAGEHGGADTPAVLLDASLSMSRPLASGAPGIWSAAVDSAAAHPGAWLFGGAAARYVSADSLPLQPIEVETRLAPALRAAAAAGSRRAVVYTDGEITDAPESLEEARRLGIALSFVELGISYPELGIADVQAPGWVIAGDTAEVRAEVVAADVDADSVRIEIVDEDGRLRAAAWVPSPEAGRLSPARLHLPIRGPAGFQRFQVRLAADPPDPERRDDQRAFYLRVTEQPAGPVLISLRPGWEPSFLIPNLDRLGDAPTAAFLLLADSLVNVESYRPTSLASVRRRARAAPLLVLHGYGADSPDWLKELAESATRLLILPTGPRAFEFTAWDVQVGAPASGEWYASADVPPSPLALELASSEVEQLPPLLSVRSIRSERAWTPLRLQRLRRGEAVAAVVAGSRGSRRWAVAAAEGYWRWAFRPGPGRQLYRTLWTGVTGWLLADRTSSSAGLEPRERTVDRGGALRWASPSDADSLALELLTTNGEAVWRRVVIAGDSVAAFVPPGRYVYAARAYRDGRLVASAEGPAEVEEFARELLPSARVSLAELVESASAATAAPADGQRRGLATLGWPYLILIALFCAEWAVRRFSGLR
jgi:hypothetical protein